MSDAAKAALGVTVRIAFRQFEELNEQEREQILLAMIEVLPAREAEVAQTVLFHIQQQRRHQLTLKSILGGAS